MPELPPVTKTFLPLSPSMFASSILIYLCVV
jgi:hypothetical protein